ncbi:MAG: hypothetical protein J0M12_16545 [Deltaproteobacteria bacterium]|nr:hypothetical protein [Deltaproteobacteria bacterium]
MNTPSNFRESKPRAKVLLLLASIAFLPVLCLAQSGVDSWGTELRFSKDGSLVITEEIKISVQPGEVVRGVSHKLPTHAGVFYQKTAHLNYTPLVGFIDSTSGKPVISNSGDEAKIQLRDTQALALGSHTFILQYKVEGSILKEAAMDSFAWPIVRPWKGGVRSYSVKIVPPEFMEPKSLVIRLMSQSGEKITSVVPSVTIGESDIVFNGKVDSGRLPLVVGIGFPRGFFP